MKPILHIVKRSSDRQAIDIIKKQALDNAYGVAVIFIQDVASLPSIPNAQICVLKEDIKNQEMSYTAAPGIELITYEDMLNLIFSVESITVW